MTGTAIIEFKPFAKIARLSREIIISEKLDGTNAQVFITPAGQVLAGSRTRWITPEEDNYGFAKWVRDHADNLRGLGPGQHFGEWWGVGIQRKYGLAEKRFSLFNTAKWSDDAVRPACCGVVPVLWQGPFCTEEIEYRLFKLKSGGSIAAPGFMNPEGIVIYHTASGQLFKKTIEKDEVPKGMVA